MGFPMRCDTTAFGAGDTYFRFQSLMGFPMRCDLYIFFYLLAFIPRFNPLWVFQCAATLISIHTGDAYFCVSIPYGLSNALRRGKSFRLPVKFDVSIPYGFSNALRPIINGRISN